MTIDAVADRHSWRRTFTFASVRAFDADMRWSTELATVTERMGVRNMIEMGWHVCFHPPSTIEIATQWAALRVAGRRIQLPAWLAVQVRAVEVADPECDNAVTVELTVSHDWLGPLFGYAGDFRLRRLDD
jgi:hypothetical protein